MKHLFSVLLLTSCLSVNAECISKNPFEKNEIAWEYLCIGAPYELNAVLAPGIFDAYMKLVFPFLDRDYVNKLSDEGNVEGIRKYTYKAVNECCKGYKRSDVHEERMKKQRADLIPRMKEDLMIDSAGAISEPLMGEAMIDEMI